MEARGPKHRVELLDAWQFLLESHALLQDRLGTAIRREFDLSMSSVEVLMRLRNSEHHQRPSTQLARQVSFSTGGLTKLIDRLEREGLVERHDAPGDRRVVLVRLTPRGELVARRCGDILAAQLDEVMLGAWNPAELADVRSALLQLRSRLQGSDAVVDGRPGAQAESRVGGRVNRSFLR